MFKYKTKIQYIYQIKIPTTTTSLHNTKIHRLTYTDLFPIIRADTSRKVSDGSCKAPDLLRRKVSCRTSKFLLNLAPHSLYVAFIVLHCTSSNL